MFNECKENKNIMEFHSDNSNLYMNETADKCLIMSPIRAPYMTIHYKDYQGKSHIIEGITFAFITDYKEE